MDPGTQGLLARGDLEHSLEKTRFYVLGCSYLLLSI